MSVTRYNLEFNKILHLSLLIDVQYISETAISSLSCGNCSCTIINADLILDPFQIVVAANKAVVSHQLGSMVTKSLSTEILYNLSIHKNISQSLGTFGTNANNTKLVVAIINNEINYNSERIMCEITGKSWPIGSIKDICNIESVKKTYNIENEYPTESILDLIITKISCKNN